MHGIVRERNFGSEQTDYAGVRHVVVRYSDGRTLTFVPEAGRENFSQDDMHELVRVLEHAYSAAEWAEIGNTAGTGN